MLAISTAPDGLRTAQRWTLVLGSFASYLVGLDALVVTTVLPTLQEALRRRSRGVEPDGQCVRARLRCLHSHRLRYGSRETRDGTSPNLAS
jgi:hypothetical protein